MCAESSSPSWRRCARRVRTMPPSWLAGPGWSSSSCSRPPVCRPPRCAPKPMRPHAVSGKPPCWNPRHASRPPRIRRPASSDKRPISTTASSRDLRQAQDAANATIKAMLAEATALQRASGEHLAAETDQAAALRMRTLAEAERVKVEAADEGEQIVSRSQQQAALIDERARQEFAWRRRQMRHEQELLDRRKVAMLSQLNSLRTLAVESAAEFPDMPEMFFEDMGEPEEYRRRPRLRRVAQDGGRRTRLSAFGYVSRIRERVVSRHMLANAPEMCPRRGRFPARAGKRPPRRARGPS